MTEEFRLLHASDLHFARRGDFLHAVPQGNWDRASWALRRALNCQPLCAQSSFNSARAIEFGAELRRRLPDLDLVVFSGDVATTGTRSDLAVAFEYFSGKFAHPSVGIRRLPNLLEPGSSYRVAFLPGNHDRFVDRSGTPGAAEFERVFGQTWDGHKNWINKADSNVRVAILSSGSERLAICMADFTLARSTSVVNPLDRFGCGRVTRSRLAQLVTATQKVRDRVPNSLVLWSVHFPPSYYKTPNDLRLIKQDDLTAAAQRLEVPMIMCGHLHERDWYRPWAAETPLVFIAGTPIGTESIGAHSFYEYTIEVDGGSLKSVYTEAVDWNSSLGRYIESKEYLHRF